MGLIDAKAFAEHLERMARTAYPNLFPGLFEAVEYAKDFPTVDAVEVVRCRDCEIHGHCVTEDIFSFSGISNPFCCAGKRKEGDGNG